MVPASGGAAVIQVGTGRDGSIRARLPPARGLEGEVSESERVEFGNSLRPYPETAPVGRNTGADKGPNAASGNHGTVR